jgi:hypothetical protein
MIDDVFMGLIFLIKHKKDSNIKEARWICHVLERTSCFLWCMWRERIDRNFEDQERTLEELKTFFYSLFIWTAAYFGSFSD